MRAHCPGRTGSSLASTPDLRRLLEIAAYDALSLENSVLRVRAITAIVTVGARLLETGELEERAGDDRSAGEASTPLLGSSRQYGEMARDRVAPIGEFGGLRIRLQGQRRV
jgi:hypothetical protein